MAYESRQLKRQKVRYDHANADNPLIYQLVLNGAKVTPTSATITVYEKSNTTALLAATAMTVSGSTLTYSLDTTTEADFPIAEGYRAEISVTYSGVAYKRHIIFDVVKFLFDPNIGFDQLVALDDGIRGMGWDSDEDMSEVINACSNLLQTKVESKVIGDGRFLQEMILDHSRFANVARLFMLAHIYKVKGNDGRSEYYTKAFDELWTSVFSYISTDEGQDGDEDTPKTMQQVRFVT